MLESNVQRSTGRKSGEVQSMENKEESIGKDKVGRILAIYSKLMNGAIVNKAEEATNFGVSERSIQRDVDDIRNYLEQDAFEHGISGEVIYDQEKKGYRLNQIYKIKLTNDEILAISKILLDSRAFTKNEMIDMVQRLIGCCVPENNRKLVKSLIANESFHYVEPRHGKQFIGNMWEIGQAIQMNHYIEIQYQGIQGTTLKTRKLKPLAFPTIYRIDRIQRLKVLEEKFNIPYKDRFEEGEFRKRIQFMFGGKLRKVKFEYTGCSVEAVLDRLPTANIVSEEDGKYVIQAEVFGDGIDMWFRSQGDKIKVLGG